MTQAILGRAARRSDIEQSQEVREYDQLARELRAFFMHQIERWQPDLVVAVERKGTAVFRALKDSKFGGIDWPWSQVISSNALHEIPTSLLTGKRLLVFDDMMRTGRHLEGLLGALDRRGLLRDGRTEVRTSVFALHENRSGNRRLAYAGRLYPDVWFYSGLPPDAYAQIREDIIGLLQVAGSLILNTEHLEVRLRLHRSVPSLYNALRRSGKAVVFDSTAGRTNITVIYEDGPATTFKWDVLPHAEPQSDSVKKCRFIERGIDEYAVIPICLPPIEVNAEGWLQRPEVTNLFGDPLPDWSTSHADVSRIVFYRAALMGALQVLEWTLKDLAAAEQGLVTVLLPQSGAGSDEYALQYLRLLYPTLRTDRLASVIGEIWNRAGRRGREVRKVRRRPSEPIPFDDVALRRDALKLLQLILLAVYQRRVDEHELESETRGGRIGLTACEIFNLGRRRGWEDVRISAMFDILIDEGHLVTRVERDKTGERSSLVRTFELDGEVVTDTIRKYTIQFGASRGVEN